MKKIVLIISCLSLFFMAGAQGKKLFRGFDGGMMIHTGFLSGSLDAMGYEVKGAPFGLGGVARLRYHYLRADASDPQVRLPVRPE